MTTHPSKPLWFTRGLANTICMLAAVGCLTAQELENPSFEEPGSFETQPQGWKVFGDHLRRETTWHPIKSGEALLGYGHWRVTENVPSGIWQQVQGIAKGDEIVFSISVMADACPSDKSPAESIELILESTEDGRQVTVASQKFSVADIPPGAEWQKISVEGKAPTDSLRLMILVTPSASSDRSAALKFDDAELLVTKGS